jgi:hypothetical protein
VSARLLTLATGRTATADPRPLSVCTGALVYADAGLLDGRPAVTWWGALDRLAELGTGIEVRRDARFVDDGDVIAAAGVSAGIDMALHLVARLDSVERAREVRRYIQYDPEPRSNRDEAWSRGKMRQGSGGGGAPVRESGPVEGVWGRSGGGKAAGAPVRVSGPGKGVRGEPGGSPGTGHLLSAPAREGVGHVRSVSPSFRAPAVGSASAAVMLVPCARCF